MNTRQDAWDEFAVGGHTVRNQRRIINIVFTTYFRADAMMAERDKRAGEGE